MDRTVAGLLGAVGALALNGAAQAAPAAPLDVQSALAAHSYADLFKPIPNAAALLEQSNEALAAEPPVAEQVQYYEHHHHHHHRYRRVYHPHHPHHHHPHHPHHAVLRIIP